MIYKFIDNNGSEISVNSLSSLQALVDSETVKENTKVKAGLRGKWTTASKIEELLFAKEKIKEPEETQAPKGDIKSFITKEKNSEEIPSETKSEEVSTQPWQTKKKKALTEKVLEVNEEKNEVEDEEKFKDELEEEQKDKTYDDENVIGLNFFQAIAICLKKYFTIKGRASRSEYWFLQLLVTPSFIYVGFMSDPVSTGAVDPSPFFWVLFVMFIILFIPAITSQIRRFHDRDKSGWFILVNMIPFIGWIFILLMLIEKGTEGKNRFCDYPLKLKKN